MKRIRRWLITVGIILLTLMIVLAGAGVWLVRRPWPQTSGTIQVAGLSAPVEVRRDQWGVPQIYAQNEHDLFFAQGYVHAQDRLWQMDFHRHYISGTLSEFAGRRTLYMDQNMRVWGLRRIAEQTLPTLDDESRAILEAYSAGVNAYIETHRDRLPVEFTIFGFQPAPWTPVDCLLWGNFMAVNQALNYSYEMLRAQIIAKLGEDAAQELLPPYSADTPVIIPPGDYDWWQEAERDAERLGLTPAEDSSLIIPPEAENYAWLRSTPPTALARMNDPTSDLAFGGSGAWVVSGEHTESGLPMLASDAHLNLVMPSMWYENGLHGGRFDVVGFSFPGTPLVALGHNQRIAWSYTLLEPDVVDLYIERLDDAENPTQYEFMGQWYDLDIVHETIDVRGGDPVPFDIYFTRHGPIVNKMFGLNEGVIEEWPESHTWDIWPYQEAISLRWPLFEGNAVCRSLVQLNLAQNWDEFRSSLQYWETLALDFVYADVDGNIGYQAAGKIPIRVRNHQGIVPVPGWTGEYEWQDYIPREQLPSLFNPAAGFIAVANNKVVSDDYPYRLTYDWFHDGYRARRINELIASQLAAGHLFNMQDMHDIQTDTYSYPAEIFRPYLLAAVEPENALQAQALAYASEWDLRCETDRVGASIYETWYSFMVENTFDDELLQNTVWGYYYPQKQVLALAGIIGDPNNEWFDDVGTPQRETRDDIIRRSFAEAVDWLRSGYGRDVGKWEWRRMHTVTIPHAALNGVPVLQDIFGSRIYPFPGDAFTVNLAFSGRNDEQKHYGVWVAAQQRMILDLEDWDAMLASNSTGQSGHLAHPNREDQTPVWQGAGYHVMPFNRQAVEATANVVLTLTPQE
jgi:penicillin amidase